MFRYHFDVSRSIWLIQFLKLGLFWFTAKREIVGPDGTLHVDLTFDTIEEAEAHVAAHGIDKVYRRMANPLEREPMFYVPGR